MILRSADCSIRPARSAATTYGESRPTPIRHSPFAIRYPPSAIRESLLPYVTDVYVCDLSHVHRRSPYGPEAGSAWQWRFKCAYDAQKRTGLALSATLNFRSRREIS